MKRGRFANGYMYSYYVPQATGTPWRPCWSPDGKEIAFSMSGSIWKVKLGDTVAQELTANTTYDSAPAWSPDGRWIAYTAEDSQGVNLMLLGGGFGRRSNNDFVVQAAEIAKIVPGYGGITYARLERGGLVAPVATFMAEGTPILAPGADGAASLSPRFTSA